MNGRHAQRRRATTSRGRRVAAPGGRRRAGRQPGRHAVRRPAAEHAWSRTATMTAVGGVAAVGVTVLGMAAAGPGEDTLVDAGSSRQIVARQVTLRASGAPAGRTVPVAAHRRPVSVQPAAASPTPAAGPTTSPAPASTPRPTVSARPTPVGPPTAVATSAPAGGVGGLLGGLLDPVLGTLVGK